MSQDHGDVTQISGVATGSAATGSVVGTGIDVVDALLSLIAIIGFCITVFMAIDTLAYRRGAWWYSTDKESDNGNTDEKPPQE